MNYYSINNKDKVCNKINYLILINGIQSLSFIGLIIYMVININDIQNKLNEEINYIDIIKNNSFLDNKTLTDKYINDIATIISQVCKIIKC